MRTVPGGCRSCHPDNWTPDEGEDPEIVTVTTVDGEHDVTLSVDDAQLDALKRDAWEDQKQQIEDSFDPPDDY